MSIWQRVEDDRAAPHLEARRQRVDEPRQDGLRVEADDAPDGPVMPEVGLVGRAVGQDPFVAGHDVGVGPGDDADPPIEVQAKGVLLRGQLAVEVDQADGRQRLGRLVEEAVRVGERVLDRLHVGPALEVDHRDVGAVERLVGAPSPPGHLVRAVVERSQDAFAGLEVRVDLALVPDVVARRDDVDARKRASSRRSRGSDPSRRRRSRRWRSRSRCRAPRGAPGSSRLDGLAAGLADQVADHQDAAGAGRSGALPFGGCRDASGRSSRTRRRRACPACDPRSCVISPPCASL